MSLIVNTNVAALNVQRNLGRTNSKLAKSLERLSSGLRINSASDDAAGLAIASKMGSQVRGLNQAVRNANNAITLTQTAEGGLNTITNILHRLRELSVQSTSDDNTSADRTNLVNEADNLVAELTRMANVAEYNTMPLLDGSFSNKYFQVGANYSQKVTFTISDSRGKSIGGRAQFSADIADGTKLALNANFGSSEVKINGYGVAATTSSDDQYSVLEVMSGTVTDMVAAESGAFSMIINDQAFAFTLTSGITAESVVDVMVSAVNGLGITNVSAFTIGDTWGIRATNGTDLELGVTSTTALSAVGMEGMSVMFNVEAATSANDYANYNGQSSAIAKAVAINAIKGSSGVQATAQANTVTGSGAVATGSISSGDVYINGVNLGAVSVENNDSTGALVSAINGITSSTGVSASTNTDNKLILTAADGRNITVTTKNDTIRGYLNLNSSAFANSTAVFRSTVQMNDDAEIALTGTLADLYDMTDDFTKTTATSNTISVDTTSYNVAALSINTQANAEAAILTIDAALDDITGIRAEIGAVQNRLEFTVSNLEISSENMSAAQSRIMDADFATETATFTKNQIMVQAATAILAQANTMPQLALQLLG